VKGDKSALTDTQSRNAPGPAALARFPFSSRAVTRLQNLNQVGLVLSLFVLGGIFASVSPYFLLPENGLNISRAVSFWGISAAAATLVLVCGLLDLSIGATMGFVGVLCAVLISGGVSWPVAMFAGLLAGAIFGAGNGVLVAYVGINPFIVTIGSQFVIRGLAFLVSGGQDHSIPSREFNFLGQGDLGRIPASAVLTLAVFAALYWTMRFTRFGRHVFAIGGSGEAARLVGIPVARRRFQVLVLSGVLAALSGIVLSGFTGSGLAYNGQGVELTVISAVILGGTSLLGGRGSVTGTLLGVALLGIINNGIVLLGVSTYWQFVVQGSVLLLAVVIDEMRIKRAVR